MKYTIGEIDDVVKSVFEKHKDYKVWLMNGDMGAGKTTFVNALSKYLNVEGVTSSPTFSIVNEYETTKVGLIYHFDCYRIKDDFEVLDLGVEDYLNSGNYCFIEWPEKIVNFLPEECLEIEILQKDDYLRELVIREHGKRSI